MRKSPMFSAPERHMDISFDENMNIIKISIDTNIYMKLLAKFVNGLWFSCDC